MSKVTPNLGQELEAYDCALTERTVLRLARKVFSGEEVLDLRLWQRDKKGKLYPRKGQGLCMKSNGWIHALKLFKDNSLPVSSESITII